MDQKGQHKATSKNKIKPEPKKIVHHLDTPFSSIEWPKISQEDQESILELLCHLLAPLGTYRRSHVVPSKGKRKRKRSKLADEDDGQALVPPAPELASYVDVGLSQISRTLQRQASPPAPQGSGLGVPAPRKCTSGSSSTQDGAKSEATTANEPLVDCRPYSLVFVARSGQSPAFNCHFPQMVAVAASKGPPGSQTQPHIDSRIRLVGFSKACEERLSSALGIPRVSSIALREGAPMSKGLVDFVRERVPPVEVEWLAEARSGKFVETRITAVSTKIGAKRVKP